jgi:hypothetical protein
MIEVPKFFRPVYFENKTQVGKIDEILGPVDAFLFSVDLSDGIVASSVPHQSPNPDSSRRARRSTLTLTIRCHWIVSRARRNVGAEAAEVALAVGEPPEAEVSQEAARGEGSREAAPEAPPEEDSRVAAEEAASDEAVSNDDCISIVILYIKQ